MLTAAAEFMSRTDQLMMWINQWWANPNHDWITHNDLIWRTKIWFGKRVVWFEFDLKSVLNMQSHRKIEEGQTVDQNCGGTAVQDGEQW